MPSSIEQQPAPTSFDVPPGQTPDGTWLPEWDPESPDWDQQGRSLANMTLWITTFNLMMAFVVWFVVSALVVRLEFVGFSLSTSQLYWLTAMPGLQRNGRVDASDEFIIGIG